MRDALSKRFRHNRSKQHQADTAGLKLIANIVKRQTHHLSGKGLMYDKQTFQPGTKEPTTSLASQTRTTQQHWLLDDVLQASHSKLENYTLIVVPLGLIAVWAIALVWVRQQQKQHNHSNRLSNDNRPTPHHRIPCRSCQFFKNSPYLKCAINPIDALTQRAINCTDYAPNVPSNQRKTSNRKG